MNKLWIVFLLLTAACQAAEAGSPPPGAPTVPAAQAPSSAAVLPEATVTEVEGPGALPTATVPPVMVELEGSHLPPGFSLIKFADLYRPTGFAFDRQGSLYATSQDGNVYVLSDEDGDGRSDGRSTFATGFYFPLGVTLHPATGDVYLSHQGAITILRDEDGDGRADSERFLVEDLPYDKHQNNNLEFGPDGWLYIGVGSTCDACEDPDPRSASILRFAVETGESEIFATGMRNPFDLAFLPGSGELFATDNGRDDLGLEAPFEELNHIIEGGDYGYPPCWNDQIAPGCEETIAPIAFFEPHSSANGVDAYAGERFPAVYQGNLFVSIFGSWLKPGVQTGIQRVRLIAHGNSFRTEAEWFIRFPAGVMLLPVLFGPDDALYVGDYVNDAIYRISYGMP